MCKLSTPTHPTWREPQQQRRHLARELGSQRWRARWPQRLQRLRHRLDRCRRRCPRLGLELARGRCCSRLRQAEEEELPLEIESGCSTRQRRLPAHRRASWRRDRPGTRRVHASGTLGQTNQSSTPNEASPIPINQATRHTYSRSQPTSTLPPPTRTVSTSMA